MIWRSSGKTNARCRNNADVTNQQKSGKKGGKTYVEKESGTVTRDPKQARQKPRNTRLCRVLGRKRKTIAPMHSCPRAARSIMPNLASWFQVFFSCTGMVTVNCCCPRAT